MATPLSSSFIGWAVSASIDLLQLLEKPFIEPISIRDGPREAPRVGREWVAVSRVRLDIFIDYPGPRLIAAPPRSSELGPTGNLCRTSTSVRVLVAPPLVCMRFKRGALPHVLLDPPNPGSPLGVHLLPHSIELLLGLADTQVISPL